MAKVQSAIIKACLITSRHRADGTYPIVIRVQFNGRAEKYLPISVPINAWDAKRGKVKSSYKASFAHNRLITNELLKIEQRKLQFETNSVPYTAKMLLSDDNYLQLGNSLIYRDLYERMLKIKHYAVNTVRLYRYAYNVLSDYIGRDDFLITELTSQYLEGFCRWLVNERGINESSVNSICAKIGVVYRYALDSNLVDEVKFPYPFKKFKYWQTYKNGMNRFGLTLEVMQILENDYINQCIYADGIQGIWWYRDNVVDTLLRKRYSELFVQCLLLMCYKMQGIALCDLVRVRAENISVQRIDNEEYYIFSDLRRKKTGELIDVISVKKTDCNAALFECFISTMSDRDGWFLPLLANGKDKKQESVVSSVSQLITKKIPKIFDRIDRENNGIIRNMGLDVDRITYYTFRHTFASVYVNECAGNPVYLAQLMGRSVNNIFTYVNGLNNIESLVREKNRIDNKS